MLVCVLIEEQTTEMESVNICRVNKKCVHAHDVHTSCVICRGMAAQVISVSCLGNCSVPGFFF